MNAKNIIPAMLLMGAMVAGPALANSELAGVVQANQGGTIIVGAEGRVYAVPSSAVFLLNQQRIDPRALQPGMPVQIYMDGSLRSYSLDNGNYNQNYNPNNYNRGYYWR